jgi:uncharacterized damage-inducible protein DinB
MRVIDACLERPIGDLETSVLGTRGPIIETLRHLVLSDTFDLFVLSGDSVFDIDDERMTLVEARATMERNGAGWAEYVARPLDPDEMVHEIDKSDGYQRWAPVGFRLAGALDHGSDHRSQVCTALTSLGAVPPRIDVFDFGLDVGRIVEKVPGA